jgi:hypothetical protein
LAASTPANVVVTAASLRVLLSRYDCDNNWLGIRNTQKCKYWQTQKGIVKAQKCFGNTQKCICLLTLFVEYTF